MCFRILFYLLLLMPMTCYFGTAGAQQFEAGLSFDVSAIQFLKPGFSSDNYMVQFHNTYCDYKGLSARFNGYPDFSVGIGMSSVYFDREIQGVFPESNQYGVALLHTQLHYWSFPVSVCLSGSNTEGLVLSYTPSITGYSEQSAERWGGALSSEYIDAYPSGHVIFQHSFHLAYNLEIAPNRRSFAFQIRPFAGAGSGYLTSQKQSIATFSYGVSLSILYKFQHIHNCPYHTSRNEKKKRKEEERLKKQKEIEDKLNKKP